MVQIAIQPIVLKDAVMTLGIDNYERNLSSVLFTPSASLVKWKGLSPNSTFTDTTIADWACAISFAQDWNTPASLSRLLYTTAEGTVIPATFKPRSGSGPSFLASLIATPGAIGGAVDSVAEASVTLGCMGKPILQDVGATAPLITSTHVVGGGVAGGNPVQVFGGGFTGVTAIKFGTVGATVTTFVSDSLIVAIAPAQAAGSKPITVVTPAGTSNSSPYTYA